MNSVIEVTHLSHRYGQRLALNDLSFQARPGEVLGLLGPNGAGKTTTVRLLNGLFKPSAGQMRVLDLDPVTQGDQVRRQTGVLTETPALYERLTANQNLEFFATLAGMSSAERKARIRELLSFFELSERANDRAGAYSKGMKQRLALARALLAHPAVLFLDEPTSGLDPEAALQVHELIAGVRSHNGQTVLLCTHNLVEAQRLCDRVAILKNGHLLAFGSPQELQRQYIPGLWVDVRFFQPPDSGVLTALSRQPGVLQAQDAAEAGLRLQVEEEATIPHLVQWMVGQGAQILSLQPRPVSLEEIYFKLQDEQQEEVK
ncbi:MAG TPA: ABC transporter ATP-binding protein [Anaerolineaceae bacterium]|nr:ABC transporter ATP-binding protein [Anaerolineaceae bacterium]